MHACTLAVELRVPAAGSLKAKRAAIRPILDGARARFRVAAAEVGFQEQWQRALLGFATVAGDAHQVTEVLDKLERFVWSHPDVEVVAATRSWLEEG